MSLPDPRSPGRIHDPTLLRRLHTIWRECAICGDTKTLSLHHVLKNPRQDVREGLVMLCGDGVRGCHGRIEANDPKAHRALAKHIVSSRIDVIDHLIRRLGWDAAALWLSTRLASPRDAALD